MNEPKRADKPDREADLRRLLYNIAVSNAGASVVNGEAYVQIHYKDWMDLVELRYTAVVGYHAGQGRLSGEKT